MNNDLIDSFPILWRRLSEIDSCLLILLNEIDSYHIHPEIHEIVFILSDAHE